MDRCSNTHQFSTPTKQTSEAALTSHKPEFRTPVRWNGSTRNFVSPGDLKAALSGIRGSLISIFETLKSDPVFSLLKQLADELQSGSQQKDGSLLENPATIEFLSRKRQGGKTGLEEVIGQPGCSLQVKKALADALSSWKGDIDLPINKDLDTLLGVAVRQGDWDLCEHLLKSGAAPEFIKGHKQLDKEIGKLLNAARVIATLKRIMPSTASDNKSVLLHAIKERKPDVIRALHLLGGSLKALMQDPEVKAAMQDALNGDDKGLKEALKQIPNRSKKYDASKALNCEATFSTGKAIVCRHLALYWLQEKRLDPDRKFDYSRISSVDSISSNLNSELEAAYWHFTTHAHETYMVKNDELGKLLARIIQGMEKHGEREKHLLLESPTHAMALELRIKNEQGKSRYVINFYDPNVTTAHTRAKESDISSLRALTMSSFLNSWDERHYYGAEEGVSMLFAIPPDREETASSPKRRRQLSSSSLAPGAVEIHYLLRANLSEDLRRLKKQIIRMDPDRIMKLFSYKPPGESNEPGMAIAMYRGCSDVIKAWGEILKASALSSDQKATLLAESNAAYAMNHNHADAIRAWGEIVLAAELQTHQKTELLKTANPAYAMSNGCSDAIRVWGEILDLSDLPADERAKLLNDIAPHMEDIDGDVDASKEWANILASACL